MSSDQTPDRAPDQPAAGPAPNLAVELSPDVVTSKGLPVVMRGYDRERVDHLLSRVSAAYDQALRQRDTLRERVVSLERDLEAAEGEAKVSARSVAELTQRVSTAESDLAATRAARDGLTQELERAEAERRQAVAELAETAARADELGKRAEALEEALRKRAQEAVVTGAAAPPAPSSVPAGSEAEAARLLIAAARASDELRASTREQARIAMKKVRARAAAVSAEMERERAELAELHDRRLRVEREAQEVLARAHAEAERVAVTIGEERNRVRALLTGALASLDGGATETPAGLVADLSSRLRDTASDGAETSEATLEPDA